MSFVQKRFALAAAVALLAIAGVRAADGPYVQVADIQIGGAGRFDYLNADGANKRLYVSHGTEAVVIDTTTNAIIGRIADTPGIHGIAIAPELGRVFTSNGADNKVSIVNAKDFTTIMKVGTGLNPDAIMYEPTKKMVWSFDHTGKSATVIDAQSGKVVATVPLSGVAETGQADAGLGKVFVNIEDTDSIDVIDMNTYKVVGNYKVAPAKAPTGMALDPKTHRIFVTGGDAPTMVMMDAATGKVVAQAPTCSGSDATWIDNGLGRAFASCSDGHITVLTIKGDTLTPLQTIDTARGARTMTVDPVTHRLYTLAVKYPPADPTAKAGARAVALPDSFHVLVYGPK